jgi:hypothetical protein
MKVPSTSLPSSGIGVLAREDPGVLFSLGVAGFAVTVALQQPRFPLIGWIHIEGRTATSARPPGKPTSK